MAPRRSPFSSVALRGADAQALALDGNLHGQRRRFEMQLHALAIQGLNDEYGTLEQIRGIARHTPQTELLELPDCGHSPHRDQPQALIGGIQRFFKRHSA